MSLLTRVFLINALVFVAAGLALAFTPATVSSPIALREGVVLLAALTAIVVLNLLVLRRTFSPLARLIELMERVEPLRPGRRVPVYGGDKEIVRLTSAFNDMLGRLERERRQSLRQSLAAQEGERRRVAQELHDQIGQSLTALLLQMERLARAAPAELRDELAEVRESTRATLEEVREVARRLRPEALDDLGLDNAVAALCQRVSDQSGVTIARRIDPDVRALPPEVELVVYRVVQEALTNTLRHADASSAEVALRRNGDRIALSIRDDGRGLDGARWGAGITGMRERAFLLGGQCEVHTRPEGGTEVRLDLEVPAQEPS